MNLLGLFCLRLAFGLLLFLLPLWSSPVNPRFFRAHFLTALGLCVGAFLLLGTAGDVVVWYTLLGSVVVCALGSMAWLLERAPGGRLLIAAGASLTGAALAVTASQRDVAGLALALVLADEFTSAAVLGSATTAMLLGHSYLIAPTMSIRPLLHLLLALGLSLLLRAGVAVVELALWNGMVASQNPPTEQTIWLATRWGVGILAPLVLGWMTWETARIRSTQSATGILYVVVICCFLGELTGQLWFDAMIQSAAVG